jgi:sec-independent protein translocase protein TatB
MFDISWSELLILGVVALIFVGPKELPILFRTLGRYAGIVRRQASEFREQFDAAMRESEFEQMRQDLTKVKDDLTNSVREAEVSASSIKTDIDKDIASATRSAESAAAAAPPAEPEKG